MDKLLEKVEGTKPNINFLQLITTLASRTLTQFFHLSNTFGAFDCGVNITGCYQAKHETMFRIMKDGMYQPHMVDLNVLYGDSNNFTSDLSQILHLANDLTENMTTYRMIDLKKPLLSWRRNGTKLNLEPFLPFCQLAGNWSNPPIWGSNKYVVGSKGSWGHELSEFCTLFRPTLTDNGVCYTYNDLTTRNDMKPSKFLAAYKSVFELPERAYPSELFKSDGIGAKNGLVLVLDAHTKTGSYKYFGNTDNTFLLSVQNPDSFPMPQIEGITVQGGFITK